MSGMRTHMTTSAAASTVDASENTHMPVQSVVERMGLATPSEISMPMPTFAPQTPDTIPRFAGSYHAAMITGPAVMVTP